MTHKSLKELMEKAKAATPGPWATEGGMNLYVIAVDDGMVAQMRGVGFGRTVLEQGNNAKFIAGANPQVVLDLCERVIGLSEAFEEIKQKDPNLVSKSEAADMAIEFVLSAREALERFGVK